MWEVLINWIALLNLWCKELALNPDFIYLWLVTALASLEAWTAPLPK